MARSDAEIHTDVLEAAKTLEHDWQLYVAVNMTTKQFFVTTAKEPYREVFVNKGRVEFPSAARLLKTVNYVSGMKRKEMLPYFGLEEK